MFSYYGSKSKVVDLYPSPKFGKIIEPFAGSARYSLKYFDRDILLVDKYEVIIKIWKWLQKASEADVMNLPTPDTGDNLDNFNFDVPEQKWLMGFLIKAGVDSPRLTVNSYRNSEYIQKQKRDIANQLFKIRHWEIEFDSYENLKNDEATWFIDPPYQFGGEYYKVSNKHLDYSSLGNWCESRNGQIIVCENTKASWLPFCPMREMSGTTHTTIEAIWSNYRHDFQAVQSPLFSMVGS
jgi:site-specific DNA-adenine methylase